MKTLSHNDFGRKFLVEECRKVGVGDFAKAVKMQMKDVFSNSRPEIMNKPVELTTTKLHFGGTRYWFKCPICNKRVGVLFVHPLNQSIGCRTCLNLDYRKRRYKGMIEGKIA